MSQPPDLPHHGRARTIAWQEEADRVLAPSWQFVLPLEALRAPLSHEPVTLLEGAVDEPLVALRDEADQLRALSNVCTHRGALVATGAGSGRKLRCPYHGRRFGLDGRCEHMPSFDNVPGFPGERDHLRAFPAEALGPLLFTAIEPPATPFAQWVAPVLARVGHLPLEAMRLDPGHSRDYLARCHWALYVENYLEGFHIPHVHASLHEAVDEGSYAVECAGDCVLQVAEARGGAAAFSPPPGHPDHGRAIAAWYFWLFPNVMLNFYPWGLSLNVVKPLGPDRTRISFLSFVLDPALLDQGAGSGLDRVEREDEAIVESVQRGARSRFFRQGQLAPLREAGVLHFQALLARALGT